MNGYIALEINGEKVGLKFGMPANRWFTEKLSENIELISKDGVVTEIGVAYLIYFGYLNNCLVKEETQKHGFGYFMEYVEEALLNEDIMPNLIEVSKVYADSRYTQEWVKRIDNSTEEVKKKMIGIISNPSVLES
jgi:hypothetical protein